MLLVNVDEDEDDALSQMAQKRFSLAPTNLCSSTSPPATCCNPEFRRGIPREPNRSPEATPRWGRWILGTGSGSTSSDRLSFVDDVILVFYFQLRSALNCSNRTRITFSATRDLSS